MGVRGAFRMSSSVGCRVGTWPLVAITTWPLVVVTLVTRIGDMPFEIPVASAQQCRDQALDAADYREVVAVEQKG